MADTTYCGSPFVFILEDISIYPKVKRCFMCYVDYLKIWLFKLCANLPYVLNGPIYLFLFEIFSTSAEVDILHNIGVLQD
jgi:hypothetical protein